MRTHPRAGRALRLAIAATGVGAALLGSAGIASAEPEGGNVSAQMETQDSPTVTGKVVKGPGVNVFTTEGNRILAREINLSLSTGEEVLTYCIDIETAIADGANYIEANWKEANPQSDLPRILWVLEHSVPNVETADVLEAAGLKSTGDSERDDLIVYAGTQAAIWHFSDDAELGPQGAPEGGEEDLTAAEYAMVKTLFDFLVDPARNVGIDEPEPSLAISPANLTGDLNKPIGPFTVQTTAESITITASEGARVVDAAGKPVTTAKNGDTIFVVSTTPKASISLSGTGLIPTGRVFVDADDPDSSQKLVLATPTEIEVSATIAVQAKEVPPSPSASPPAQSRPTLPTTGATPWGKVGIGVVLLGAGAGLLLFTRRRRATN